MIHRALFAICVLAGCSARPLGLDEVDCTSVIFDRASASQMCGTPAWCEIHGALADGRALKQRCTSEGCSLFVDGVEACACPRGRLDYANTCYNGFPTCIGWQVDYSQIDYCFD